MASNVPWVVDFIHSSPKSGDISVWESALSKKTILFSDFLLLLAKKTKNEKRVIFHRNGKMGSWISHMLYPIHSTKWWDQKKFKKTYCRVTFWFGRKMGRIGCRPWKCVKFKKKKFLLFMAIMWLVDCIHKTFCQTFSVGARTHNVRRPKNAYFSHKTWSNPYGTVQAPRSKLLTLGRPLG